MYAFYMVIMMYHNVLITSYLSNMTSKVKSSEIKELGLFAQCYTPYTPWQLVLHKDVGQTLRGDTNARLI